MIESFMYSWLYMTESHKILIYLPLSFKISLHRHPDFVKSLVDYIIREPKDDEPDKKICYKYPFVASEILGSEILGLIKAFFEDAQEGDSRMSLSKNFDQISQESATKDPEKEAESQENKESPVKKAETQLKEEMGPNNSKKTSFFLMDFCKKRSFEYQWGEK